ncbi:MerR family transcriptional regulator [Streptomyces sp. NPDC059003]|uniref:MerR family transcriptional regulator n=1 Tax=Streptomyces sp. NPDC059003 TaxID=3346691 RepID=UPI0036CC3A1B
MPRISRRCIAELKAHERIVQQRLLTTAEAAAVAGVQAACIRQWVSRGYLQPTARQGNRNLYREDHVLQVERDHRKARSITVLE